MYIKVYKSMMSKKILNSNKVFFPTLIYFMMVSNYYQISYFSVGNILDYFSMPRTNRNFNDIMDCLELMSKEGLIRRSYNTSNKVKMNDLIAYELIIKDVSFFQVQDFEIEKIIEIYTTKEQNYMFAIIFLLLKFHSFASEYITENKIVEYAKVSYATIMRGCSIKSNTTMTKYTNLLSDYGIVEIDKDFNVEDYTTDDGKTKQSFKTIHTYYFKERD
jgi:hypothetical protein